jgi:hypothetical protein
MGGKQLSFSDYEQKTAMKHARSECFLRDKEEDMPWKSLIDLIEPRYSPIKKPWATKPVHEASGTAPLHQLIGSCPSPLREAHPIGPCGLAVGLLIDLLDFELGLLLLLLREPAPGISGVGHLWTV